jgi:hypothetical protein
MKKIKVLLTAVTVLTVVGAGLAFKAAKFNKNYCTKDASGQCTSYALNSKVLNSAGLVWAVETTDTQNCTKTTAPQCTSQIRITPEN